MQRKKLSLNGKTGGFLAFLVVVACLVGSGLLGASDYPEDIGGTWDSTTFLAQAAPSDACPEGMKCAEWCTLYQGGTARPTGLLCCVPEGVNNDFNACASVVGLRN